MKITLGLYGLYLLLVVIRGNGGKFTDDLTHDMGGFLPWLIVAAVLGGLYEFEPTHKIAGWFLVLVVTAFVLKNYGNLQKTFGAIYNTATTPSQNGSTVGNFQTLGSGLSLPGLNLSLAGGP